MKNGDYCKYAGELREKTEFSVVARGGILSLSTDQNFIRSGKADMVGMVQASIADPALIEKSFNGYEEKVSQCTECGRCRYIKRRDLTSICILEVGYQLANRSLFDVLSGSEC